MERDYNMQGWKYYNHAIVPTCAPHEAPNISYLEDDTIWTALQSKEGRIFFAQWSTEFDCKHETGWWYVIKDTPFDIATLKAKRRYEITKGMKNFDVRRIDCADYKEEMLSVAIAAFNAYPKKYRPHIVKEEFFDSISGWNTENDYVYAAFHKTEEKMCSYAYLHEEGRYIAFHVLKSIPAFEKQGVNAAMVNYILCDKEEKLAKGKYICDGQRNVNHETCFPDYLEKYFGFRKAYARLNIKYRPGFDILINILFPIRKILRKFDKNRYFHMANAVLKLEEINRGGEHTF